VIGQWLAPAGRDCARARINNCHPRRPCHPRPSVRMTRADTARPAVRSSPGHDPWPGPWSSKPEATVAGHGGNPDVASSCKVLTETVRRAKVCQALSTLGDRSPWARPWGALLEISRIFSSWGTGQLQKGLATEAARTTANSDSGGCKATSDGRIEGAQQCASTIAAVLILSYLALRSCSQLFMHGTDTATTCVCQTSLVLSTVSWASLTNQV
jgi:hypothetical protein